MHPFHTLALAAGGSALDDMLRYIGIAAIVWAFFKGLKSLVAKPAAAPPPPAVVPAPAAVVGAAPVAPPQAAAPVVAKAVQPVQAEGLTPEIIAIIAAAVTVALGTAHRIVSIKSQNSHWEKSGRQSVLTSHRIR